MDPCIPLFYGANQDPQGDLEKHLIFKPVSKAEKGQENDPQGLQKTQKNGPGNTKTQFLRKRGFLRYLPNENLVFRAPTVNNSTNNSMQKVTWKQASKKHRI